MINKLKTALKMATAMLPMITLTPSAYGATFKSQTTTWSSDELSIFAEDYELVQHSEPQSDREYVEKIQGISLDVLKNNGESVSYFQNLMSTARQLRVSGTRASEGTNVPLLPQVGYSQINEGVYDFDINRQNSSPRRRLIVRPSGGRSRAPRLFKARSGVARRRRIPQSSLDFFSFRLSQFGGPFVQNEFVNLPRSEFLTSVNNYHGDLTSITPMTGSFGTLAISVRMPTLPRQSLGGKAYQKYFRSSAADIRSQQALQRQVREQMKKQEKRLKKMN